MSLQRSILAFLLMTSSVCQAQSSRLSVPNSTGRMQPWLVGMAAMVGFLFIVFVILIVKRLLKRKSRDKEESLCENSSQMEYLGVNDMKQTSL